MKAITASSPSDSPPSPSDNAKDCNQIFALIHRQVLSKSTPILTSYFIQANEVEFIHIFVTRANHEIVLAQYFNLISSRVIGDSLDNFFVC
jgi:hypothetical protein